MSPTMDVYSFGIVMYEVYTGSIAFKNLHYGGFYQAVVLHNKRPRVSHDMPAGYKALMEQVWANAEGRLGTDACLSYSVLFYLWRSSNHSNKRLCVWLSFSLLCGTFALAWCARLLFVYASACKISCHEQFSPFASPPVSLLHNTACLAHRHMFAVCI